MTPAETKLTSSSKETDAEVWSPSSHIKDTVTFLSVLQKMHKNLKIRRAKKSQWLVYIAR